MGQRVGDDFSSVAFVGGDGQAACHSVVNTFPGHGGAGKVGGCCQAAQLGVGGFADGGADAGAAFAGRLVRLAPGCAFHKFNFA